jgi:hypothetical protein
VYNRVLTPGEVSSLYTYNGLGGAVVSTVAPSLYLNNSAAVTGSAITYIPLTIANTFVGYGVAPYNNYFQGKIDDFRYYGRVLCPMEMRVLYSYAYGKGTGMVGTKTVPTLGTVTIGTNQAPIPITFSNTGTFSYLKISRTSGGITINFIVNASQLVLSGSNYVWTDATVVQGTNYTYIVTPYILGSPGIASLPSTVFALTPPTAVSVVGTGTDATHFSLAINGGTSAYSVVNYTYNINGQGFGAGYTTTSTTSQNPTVTFKWNWIVYSTLDCRRTGSQSSRIGGFFCECTY